MVVPLLLTALGAALAAQDTVVVRADNPPEWGMAPRLVEDLRIGALEGDEAYTFGEVRDVAVASDGTIWVADRQTRLIRRYSRDGQHLGSVGGPGEGPGEFGSINGLARLPDGRFVAWDAALVRFSLFSPDGRFEKASRVPTPIVYLRNMESLRVDDQFRLYIRSVDLSNRDQSDLIWIRVDTAGTVLDTIPVPPLDTEGPRAGGKRYQFGRMPPFSYVTVSAPSPMGYLVKGRTNTYALFRPLPDGRVLRIERSWSPVRVGRRERAEFQTQGDHSRQGRQNYPETSTSVPREKPPFWALWVDQEGRIWVARHSEARRVPETESEREQRLRAMSPPPPAEWWEPLVLDVIDPEGTYLGTVTFEDHRIDLREARGREIWTIERGEFDETYVVRYRIEAGGG
jgi:hypothetical protein